MYNNFIRADLSSFTRLYKIEFAALWKERMVDNGEKESLFWGLSIAYARIQTKSTSQFDPNLDYSNDFEIKGKFTLH